MKKIFKYEIPPLKEIAEVKMHKGFDLLDIQVQGTKLCAWAIVEDSNELVITEFVILGTGREIPKHFQNTLRHVKTIQHGPEVWHVFKKLT